MDSATAEDTDSRNDIDTDDHTSEHPMTALVVMIFCVLVLLTILLWFGRQNQWSWCQQFWGHEKAGDDAITTTRITTPPTIPTAAHGDDPTLDESDTSQVDLSEDDEEENERGDAAIVTTPCIEQV